MLAAGHNAAWLIPIPILGATIFDTTLISISRPRRGFIPFTTPGKDHTAHRLSPIFFQSQRTAVLLMYDVGAFFGLMALLISRLSMGPAYAVAAPSQPWPCWGQWLCSSAPPMNAKPARIKNSATSFDFLFVEH